MSARAQLIELSHQLLADELVVRTWGNFSLRLDEGHFLITPSGRRYETMAESDLCDVAPDDTWAGPYKPSGEAPMHHLVYELFPAARCVIHTHQKYASALSLTKGNIELTQSEAELLGQEILPIADYALPTTPMLHKKVKKSLGETPVRVTLLKAHGAIIWAETAEEARRLGNALEEICEARYFDALSCTPPTPRPHCHSERVYGKIRYFDDAGNNCVPGQTLAANHERIYAAREDVEAIIMTRDSEVGTFFNRTLKPYLDDFAQLVGLAAGPTIKKHHAIITKDQAFCLGANTDEAHAVRMVVEKNARAARYASLEGAKPINAVESLLMRQLYLAKYSKAAD